MLACLLYSYTGDLTVEGFTLMIIFKNIFSFILTFFAYDWLIKGGIKHTMIAISIVQVVVCVISVPMCKSFFTCPPVLLYICLINVSGCRCVWQAHSRVLPSP